MIFAFADIETTGLSQEKGDRIIEAAILMCDETGRRLGSWSQRVNPGVPIDPEAQAVHGISAEDLIDCPSWEVVAPKFAALLSKAHYHVAHNGEGFDWPFILREFMRAGVGVPTIRSIDTMLQGRWATPDGALPSLKALAFACGVEYDTSKAHAALYDVTVMADCFFVGYPSGYFAPPLREFSLAKEAA